jgi:O-antigen ligase
LILDSKNRSEKGHLCAMLAFVKEGFRSSFSIYLLAFAMGALPLIYSFDTLDPVLAPRLSFLGLLIVLLSLLSFRTKSLSIPKLSWLFFVFILVEASSLLYAKNPIESYGPIVRDSTLLIFMILVYQLVKIKNTKELLAKTLLIASIIISAYAIYQLITLDVWQDSERIYEVKSFMGHRNLLASSLLLLWPWIIFLIYRSKSWWRLIGIFTLIISVFFIMVLESRTVWLAAVAFLAFFMISGLLSKVIKRLASRFWLLLFIGALSMIFAGFVFLKVKHGDNAVKAQELNASVNVSSQADKNFTVSERVLLWKASFNMIWGNSWKGVGAGNWKVLFPAYGSDIWRARQGMVQFQRPHNDFIWVLAEQGVLGLMLYLSIFILLVFSGLKSIANTSLSQSDRVFLRLLISGVVAYIIIGFFSFPRERIFHQTLLFLSFAFILGNEAKGHFVTFKPKVFSILALLVGGICMAFGLNWWHAEKLMVEINKSRYEGEWQQLLKYYGEIENNRFYQIDAISIPTSFYAGLAHLNLANYPQSEDAFTKAYLLHSTNIHVINNLANIKLLSAKTDTAIFYYRKALEVSPKYLDGALNLMAAYFNSQQFKEAYEVLCEYEPVFAIDNPNHSSLSFYRLKILRALETLEAGNTGDRGLLSDSALEANHFELLAKRERAY